MSFFKRTGIVLFMTALVAALFLLGGKGAHTQEDAKKNVSPVSDLKVVASGLEETPISAYEGAEDGVLRYYLPRNPAEGDLVFTADAGTTVEIDGKRYGVGDALTGLVTDQDYFVSYYDRNGEKILEKKVRFLQGSGTAALYLTLTNGSLNDIYADQDDRENAYFTVMDEEGNPDSRGYCQISGRGNRSWESEFKKPLNLTSEDTTSILQMEAGRKWALLSAPDDYTMMMDRLGYLIADKAGLAYTPECAYVNLYVDGLYQGLYLMAQRVSLEDGCLKLGNPDRSAHRRGGGLPEQVVNRHDGLEEKYFDLEGPSDVSGPYLMEFDIPDRYAAEPEGFTTDRRQVYVKSPQYMSKEQAVYISDTVRAAERAIYDPEGIDPATGKSYADFLDLDSFALSCLTQDFLNDLDADRSSSYFYKKKNDPLLYAGPIWDLNGAYWHGFFTQDPFQYQLLTLRCIRGEDKWMEPLTRHPEFAERIRKLYHSRFQPAVEEAVSAAPEIVHAIKPSLLMQYDRFYPGHDEAYVDGIPATFKNWLEMREAFYSAYLDDPSSFAVLTFEQPWDPVYRVVYAVPKGEAQMTFPENRRVSSWLLPDGSVLEEGHAFTEDTTLTPVLVEE